MKLSKNTIAILKNFSGINQNLLIRPGNKLSTIMVGNSILGVAEVEETFENSFGSILVQRS